jgi:streptogramin lyase
MMRAIRNSLVAILVFGIPLGAVWAADNTPKAKVPAWRMWVPLGQFDQYNGAVLGLDGRVWFADQTGDAFVVASENGKFTSVPTGRSFVNITRGPAGDIYGTTGDYQTILRYSPSGEITAFTLGQDANGAITAGPDGSIWIPETSEIGRILPNGSVREYPLPQAEMLGGGTSTSQQMGGDVWFDASTPKYSRYLGAMNPATGKITKFFKDDCGGYIYPEVAAPDGRVWSVCGDILYAQGYMDGFSLDEKSVRIPWPENYGFVPVGGYNNARVGPDNAIWMAGQNVVNGLDVSAAFVRFDLITHKFRKYVPPNNNFQWDASFAFDPAGNLWAGTNNGEVQEIVLHR